MKGRFFVDSDCLRKGKVMLSKTESHHALSVLRIKIGDVVELLDGKGNCVRGVVKGVKESRLLVSLDQSAAAVSPQVNLLPVQVTLAISVIKPERMELLIQKACELGVQAIVPILTQRSVVKLSKERWQSKYERWQKIVLASCKQCGQPFIPEIMPVQNYQIFLSAVSGFDSILIPTLAVPADSLYNRLKGSKAQKVLALIGPEGDFTTAEVQQALDRGAQPVSLGPYVLRSETAGIYLLSVLNFFYRECQSCS